MPRPRATPLFLIGCCIALLTACGGNATATPAVPTSAPSTARTQASSGTTTDATALSPATPTDTPATAPPTAAASDTTTSPTAVPTAAAPTVAATPTGPPQTHALPGGTVTLPAGFDIGVYAQNLGPVRFMAVRPSDGLLFVADGNGRILILPDANHDGKADSTVVFASGLNLPSSIAFFQDWVYVGETSTVSRFSAPNNATQPQGNKEVVIPNLPPPTDHWTRTIAFGPDGKLYLAIGSNCNVCVQQDTRRAAISVYDPDGKNGRLFATGLRNAVGFTWQPGTNTMWATVNGRDSIGDDIPPDELRIVRDGSFNGYPYCYNGTTPNPEFGDPSRCAQAVPAEVALPAHSAALGITFGDQFNAPQPYKESIYIAYHGSWNRSVKTGYKIVRVPFVNGQAGQPEDFAWGWLPGSADNPGAVWGRPVGVTVGSDGALYLTDDDQGRVYRIAATG
ncbi:MAG: PQQ-dependent sugar dehydrogenase [Thermomicrobia bacterium]|nr:PQQ-dependent sugar dehydrogenase [Thermomicrobia bacterium]